MSRASVHWQWHAVGLRRRLILRLMLYAVASMVGAAQYAPTVHGQDSTNQAGLVILHGDGRVVTACVTFAEPQLSGLQLLQRAGLELNIEANGTGGAVCRINGEGCGFPQQSCFCQCEGASCTYWSYWRSSEGGWQYSNLGAGSSEVKPGQVDGWVWGPGTVESAQKPPVLTLAEVCASATATNTATPAPTVAPVQAAPATPTGTGTATGTATAAPTLISTPTPFPAALPAAGPPRIEWFAADRAELAPGEAATLSWRVVDAASVMLLAGGQAAAVDAVGSTVFAPPVSVELRLEARNNSGVSSSVVQLVVRQPVVQQPAAVAPVAAALAATRHPEATPPEVAVTPAAPAGGEANAPAGSGADTGAGMGVTPVALPPLAVVPASPPVLATAPAAVSLMLPLVMQDSGQVGALPSTGVRAVDAQEVGGGAETPAGVEMPATALLLGVAETTTLATGATFTGERESVMAAGVTQGGAPAYGGSLVWLALAAVVVLPAGVGTLGYLAWRFVNRGS